MDGYTKEDFIALREKLGYMSDLEIMQAYAKVLHDNTVIACKADDEWTYIAHAGYVNKTEMFLAGYIARLACLQNGIEL